MSAADEALAESHFRQATSQPGEAVADGLVVEEGDTHSATPEVYRIDADPGSLSDILEQLEDDEAS